MKLDRKMCWGVLGEGVGERERGGYDQDTLYNYMKFLRNKDKTIFLKEWLIG